MRLTYYFILLKIYSVLVSHSWNGQYEYIRTIWIVHLFLCRQQIH